MGRYRAIKPVEKGRTLTDDLYELYIVPKEQYSNHHFKDDKYRWRNRLH